MSAKWTRAELERLVAARHGQAEGRGEGAMLTLRIKVTPELLEAMLGGTWTSTDGSVARFDGVYIDDDGYAEPSMTRVDQGAAR